MLISQAVYKDTYFQIWCTNADRSKTKYPIENMDFFFYSIRFFIYRFQNTTL